MPLTLINSISYMIFLITDIILSHNNNIINLNRCLKLNFYNLFDHNLANLMLKLILPQK